jgi:hypothetical protein
MGARHVIGILLPLVILAACYGARGVPGQSDALESQPVSAPPLPSTAGAELATWVKLPVDPSLTPISIGNLSGEASDALDACWITDTQHELVSAFGLEVVAGMAKVPHAKDLPTYLPLINDPTITGEAPAWAIRLQGEIQLPHLELVRDPSCVIIRSDPVWFVTGARQVNGEWEENVRPPDPPQFRLPALEP